MKFFIQSVFTASNKFNLIVWLIVSLQPVIEFDRNPNPLRDELLKDYKFELDKSDGGSLAVPLNGIGGLGIEVDEDMLKKFHVPLIHTGVITKFYLK